MLHHSYALEKEMELKSFLLNRQLQPDWISTDEREYGRLAGSRLNLQRFAVMLRRTRQDKQEQLRSKAVQVLHEMLEHENAEFRLRAAEIVLKSC